MVRTCIPSTRIENRKQMNPRKHGRMHKLRCKQQGSFQRHELLAGIFRYIGRVWSPIGRVWFLLPRTVGVSFPCLLTSVDADEHAKLHPSFKSEVYSFHMSSLLPPTLWYDLEKGKQQEYGREDKRRPTLNPSFRGTGNQFQASCWAEPWNWLVGLSHRYFRSSSQIWFHTAWYSNGSCVTPNVNVIRLTHVPTPNVLQWQNDCKTTLALTL